MSTTSRTADPIREGTKEPLAPEHWQSTEGVFGAQPIAEKILAGNYILFTDCPVDQVFAESGIIFSV